MGEKCPTIDIVNSNANMTRYGFEYNLKRKMALLCESDKQILLSIGYMRAVTVLVQAISDNESHKRLELLHDSDFGRSTTTVSKCYKPK